MDDCFFEQILGRDPGPELGDFHKLLMVFMAFLVVVVFLIFMRKLYLKYAVLWS